MSIWQALFLGVVQGVTEFLPVSSSGHLVIFQQLLGVTEGTLTFEITLHLATVLAIVFFFRQNIIQLRLREWLVIAVATLPVAIVGLTFKHQVEQLFLLPQFVGVTLLFTAAVNFYIDNRLKRLPIEASQSAPTLRQAVIVGLFQAIAILPGISRSGSTVAGGISQKFSRTDAFRFSFLVGIPAIMGAAVLQLVEVVRLPGLVLDWPVLLAGSVAAFFSGLISLRFFQYVLKQARMELFGWYCLVVGLLTIFWL
jgi:undecaprenyl-diphosphatase